VSDVPVPQIRYHRWGAEPPEHAWYWNAVGSMADLIGMALRSHGIYVVQTKEKYGDARVYIGSRDDEDTALSRVEDRRAYREVYAAALAAAPMLRSAILDGSDYPDLASGELDPEEEL
jgi:hypothetical protein